MERYVLDDAVALVEDAEDGNPLRHRSDAALPGRCRGDLLAGCGRVLLLVAAPAACQREAE
jgi:hypothetical protein